MRKANHALPGVLLVLVLLHVAFVYSQPPANGNHSEAVYTEPTATATSASKPPALDGQVLNDPAWANSTPASSFWQTTPDEGQPATERTEVRIIYTAEIIYFGVVCHDHEPGHMVVSDSR